MATDNLEYFKDEQKKLENLASIYREEAEKPLAGLSKNLILVATIFIALSSSVIGSTEVLKASDHIKIIFLLSLGILILSILFGLIQFIVEVRFYRKWVTAIIGVVKEMEAEFGILLLRFTKSIDENFFKNKIFLIPLFKELSQQYAKYLVQ